ncbi:uncharacterized protein LOC135462893 isoform X1 [Liolophura sinensis]|uniref:uncharacterized protein LOC135462893 isoform X1 n=1 Tax=Liolophura sinensis TaxID=3198878 RepID=UPI003157F5E6
MACLLWTFFFFFFQSLSMNGEGVKIKDVFQVVETIVGESAVLLPCSYETESSDTSIVWWYKGKITQDVRLVGINTAGKMTAMGHFKDRVTRRGKASILLDNPVVSDTGNYTCSVTITADIPPIADAVVFLKVKLPNCYKADRNSLIIIVVLDGMVVLVFVLYQLCNSRHPYLRQIKGLKLLRIITDVITPLTSITSIVLIGILLWKPCVFSETAGSMVYIIGILFGVISLLSTMFTLCIQYQHSLQSKAIYSLSVPISVSQESTRLGKCTGRINESTGLRKCSKSIYGFFMPINVSRGSTRLRKCSRNIWSLFMPISVSQESTRLEEIQENESDFPRIWRPPLYEEGHRLQRQTEFLMSTSVRYHEPFVRTQCSKTALELLATEGSVLITGNHGDGKSALGVHLLRQCREDGFRVYFIDSPGEWKRCWEPGRKQAFLMDDCIGRHGLNFKMAEEWSRGLDMLKVSLTTSRHIFVSSSVVFRSFCETFCCYDENIFGQIFNMRSEENLFSGAEKREIIVAICERAEVHVTYDTVSTVISHDDSMIGFPDFRRCFSRAKRRNPFEYFHHYGNIINELMILQNSTDPNMRAVYALLYLVTLYDGELSADLLESSEDDDEFSKRATSALTSCDLPEVNPLRILRKAKRLSVGVMLLVNLERDSLVFTHTSTLQAMRSFVSSNEINKDYH